MSICRRLKLTATLFLIGVTIKYTFMVEGISGKLLFSWRRNKAARMNIETRNNLIGKKLDRYLKNITSYKNYGLLNYEYYLNRGYKNFENKLQTTTLHSKKILSDQFGNKVIWHSNKDNNNACRTRKKNIFRFSNNSKPRHCVTFNIFIMYYTISLASQNLVLRL